MAEQAKTESETKFNMGLATLESIRKLLDMYNKVCILDSADLDGRNFQITDTLESQIIKSRLCKQLLLTSRILLKDDQKILLEIKLTSTAIKIMEFKDSTGNVVKRQKVFSYVVDKACDDFVSLLVDKLQENKVFMPGKGDKRLF